MSLQRSKAIQEFSVGEETKALLIVIVEDDEGSSHQKVQWQQIIGGTKIWQIVLTLCASDAPINQPNIRNRLISHIFTTSVINFS